MSAWSRLRAWNRNYRPELAAVVETVRDGFLVSVRDVKGGHVEDIVGVHRAAVATGRTVDTALGRALDIAEEELGQ